MELFDHCALLSSPKKQLEAAMLGSKVRLMQLLDSEQQKLRKRPQRRPTCAVNAFSSACMGVWHDSSRAGLSTTTVVHAYGPHVHHEACAFLSMTQAQALEAGIRNRQGVIEIAIRGSAGVVTRLNQYLASHGQAEVVLTQEVVIQNMAFYRAEPGREGFTCYLASVRVTEHHAEGGFCTQSFQVPLTVIQESALMDSTPNDWEHPAFFTHFSWLREQYGDVSRLSQRPTFLLPALDPQSKRLSCIDQHLTEHAFFLSRAAACRQFNPLQIVCSHPSIDRAVERGMVLPVRAVRWGEANHDDGGVQRGTKPSWLLRFKSAVKHSWFGG